MKKSEHVFFDEICRIAYDLYEKRGRAHGYDLEDWLEAEKIVLKKHVSEIQKEARTIKKIKEKLSKEKTKPSIKPWAKKTTSEKKKAK